MPRSQKTINTVRKFKSPLSFLPMLLLLFNVPLANAVDIKASSIDFVIWEKTGSGSNKPLKKNGVIISSGKMYSCNNHLNPSWLSLRDHRKSKYRNTVVASSCTEFYKVAYPTSLVLLRTRAIDIAEYIELEKLEQIRQNQEKIISSNKQNIKAIESNYNERLKTTYKSIMLRLDEITKEVAKDDELYNSLLKRLKKDLSTTDIVQ